MKYYLKYHVKVHDSKYREFLNVVENISNKHKPDKCSSRMAFQSIDDMHIFEYVEVWKERECLKEYLNSNEFKSLQGAFELLTVVKNFSITESIELEKSTLFHDIE